MTLRRTTARPLVRLGAPIAALGLVALAASPAAAHVTGTPTTTAAGASTVLTMSVGHGCEGSPTTRIEVQIPEQLTSVTPTRNPLYSLEKNIEQLDEPITDAHGNEVTERVASVVYTAETPLPEGQRDTFELSFQVPDAEGETLAFPTIQTCEQGRTGWIEVPEEGQDAEALEYPAPSFVVTAAEGDGHASPAEEPASTQESDEESGEAEQAVVEDDGMLGWAGLVLGGLGLLAGGVALSRSRTSA
jgi:periplasmic copper chaperone A